MVFSEMDQETIINNSDKIALEYNAEYNSKTYISTIIYPPPKSSVIIMIKKCPYYESKYFILSDTGKLFVYNVKDKNGILEAYYHGENILVNISALLIFTELYLKDSEKRIVNEKICIFGFYDLIPPKLDLQTGVYEPTDHTESLLKKKFICVGCLGGSIAFLDLEVMDRIYFRFCAHKNEIICRIF